MNDSYKNNKREEKRRMMAREMYGSSGFLGLTTSIKELQLKTRESIS